MTASKMQVGTPTGTAITIYSEWYSNSRLVIGKTAREDLISRIANALRQRDEQRAAEVARYRDALAGFVANEESEGWHSALYRLWEAGDICYWDGEYDGFSRELSFNDTLAEILKTDDLLTLVTCDPIIDTPFDVMTRYKAARLLLNEEAANV